MSELLRLDSVSAGYGEARVLHDVSLAVEEGQALALLGRNGTGKTTLINTIMGETRLFTGRIRFADRDITRLRSHRRALAGLGWVPQERNIFRSLTLEENLTAVARPGPWDLGRVYRLFPRLEERRSNLGNQLSGGEQQMLAVGRALITNPKLLLLDEPLEGLAPVIVEELLAILRRVIRDEGMSAVLVEQNAPKILPITDRAAILERGAVAWAGASADLRNDAQTLDRLLGLAHGLGSAA
ncbi:MAG: ABC transporter ATP-binding protein [Geminicoccales bacterium]